MAANGAGVAAHANGAGPQADNVGILAAEVYFPSTYVSTRSRAFASPVLVGTALDRCATGREA